MEIDEPQDLLLIDLPLWRAVAHSEDGGVVWYESMPLILERYGQITPDAYWRLTVAEHAMLLRHVTPKDG